MTGVTCGREQAQSLRVVLWDLRAGVVQHANEETALRIAARAALLALVDVLFVAVACDRSVRRATGCRWRRRGARELGLLLAIVRIRPNARGELTRAMVLASTSLVRKVDCTAYINQNASAHAVAGGGERTAPGFP
jgi:hypothetical protein